MNQQLLTLLDRYTSRERFSETKSNLSLAAFNAFNYLPEDNPMKIYYMDDNYINITKIEKDIRYFINKVTRIPELLGHFICRYDIGIFITDDFGYNFIRNEATKR